MRTRRYFYDTEFIDDGSTIDLVSIGIVEEGTGREYYAVSREFSVVRLKMVPWLVADVWPHLPTVSGAAAGGQTWLDYRHADVKSRYQIATEVAEFLLPGDGDPELWAWYGAYDHVALAQLWGPMVQLPLGMPYWTNDVRQELHGWERAAGREITPPAQSTPDHHALNDARYTAELLHWVETRTPGLVTG